MNRQQRENFERTLAEHFHHRLVPLAKQLDPQPQEETLWYLGCLLARFGSSDRLYGYENGGWDIRPLALLYRDALEAGKGWQRNQFLRQLGDLALFIGGLFPASYMRRGIRRDYFVGMGGSAYDYLSEHAMEHRQVFAELANTFAAFLQLIADSCGKPVDSNDSDILCLYQRWQASRQPGLAARLRAMGIVLSDFDDLQ